MIDLKLDQTRIRSVFTNGCIIHWFSVQLMIVLLDIVQFFCDCYLFVDKLVLFQSHLSFRYLQLITSVDNKFILRRITTD